MAKEKELKELPHPIQAYSEALAEIERRLSELDNGDENITVAHHTGPPFMFFQERLFNVQQRIIRLIADGVIEMPDMIVPSIPRPIQFLNARFQLLTHGVDMAQEEATADPFPDDDLVITLININGNTLTYRIDKWMLWDWKITQFRARGQEDGGIPWNDVRYIEDNVFEVSLPSNPDQTNPYGQIHIVQEGTNREDYIDFYDFNAVSEVGTIITDNYDVIFTVEQPTTKKSQEVVIKQLVNRTTCKIVSASYDYRVEGGSNGGTLEITDMTDKEGVKYGFVLPTNAQFVGFMFEDENGSPKSGDNAPPSVFAIQNGTFMMIKLITPKR